MFQSILCSENVECTTTTVNNDSTMEDTENANNYSELSASSPNADKKETECKTVSSNNNWWGSWINSAKTKVNSHSDF